jgi:gamma-glutamyltranspeptidase / glutathione hydrolase
MPKRGGLTVTVPGAVKLWEDAAKNLAAFPYRACSIPRATSPKAGTRSPK